MSRSTFIKAVVVIPSACNSTKRSFPTTLIDDTPLSDMILLTSETSVTQQAARKRNSGSKILIHLPTVAQERGPSPVRIKKLGIAMAHDQDAAKAPILRKSFGEILAGSVFDDGPGNGVDSDAFRTNASTVVDTCAKTAPSPSKPKRKINVRTPP